MSTPAVVRGIDARNSGGSAVTGLSITHTAPAGVVSGDLLIVGMQLRDATSSLSSWRVPAGWTAQTPLTSAGSGSFAVFTAKYGTDVTGTSWTWDNGAGNTEVTRWSSCLVALAGSSVSGVAGHAAQTQSGTTALSSSALTTTGNTVLVGFAGSRTTGGVTFTAPTGWVEQSDVSESAATNAVTLEVSVNNTVPVAAGSYTYAPTSSPAVTAGFASITAFTYSSSGPTAATATGSVTLSGRATVATSATASAAGTLTLSGRATTTTAATATATGALTLSGSVVGASATKSAAPPPVISTDPLRSGGFALWYTVDAYSGNTPIAGATGLRPVGGSITDTMKPGVRRTLTVELAPTPGLYDLLAPSGLTLKVTASIRDGSQATTQIPMGVFSPDSDQFTVAGGTIQITAPDLWSRIVRAKFIGPQSSVPGLSVSQQIALLIQGAVGSSTPVTITASSTATVPTLTWTKDRAQAILDLAASINAWVYADRAGNWVVADIPSLSSGIKWLADANPAGVLLSLDRQRSRTNTCNVVCVEPQSASDPSFATTWVWDTDPNSPTYAGPMGDGVTPPDPSRAGPFGLSVYYFDTALPLDPGSAKALAYNILAKTVRLSKQVSLTMGHNPNVDAGDICGVLPPPERYDIARYTESHMAETVTHPLTLDNTGLRIDGRSSRTDPYT